MSAQHTPGPWEFLEEGRTEEEFNRGRAFTIGGPRPKNDDLAQVFSCDDATVSISREEAAANASLIAAAPDLLAALSMAQAYMDVCLGAPQWQGENPYPVIAAAIAKATGAA